MTNEELAAAIQQTGDIALYHELWQQVERFVAMKAIKAHQQHDDPCIETDDLYNSGYIAMVEAAKTFSADKGASFLHWLSYFLKQAFAIVGDYRTKSGRQSPLKYASRLDAPTDDETGLTLGDVVCDSSDAYEDVQHRIWCEQLRKQLDRALEPLNEEQRTTLHCRYYDDMTLEATGVMIGKSRERTRQIESKAFKRLRVSRTSELLRDFVEDRTDYYRRISARTFNTIGMSGVELETLKRDQLERWYKSNADVR